MEELFAIKDVYSLYEGNQLLVMVCIMFVAFYPLLIIMKRVVSPGVKKIAKVKGENYSQILDNNHLTTRLIHLFIAFYLMFWGGIFDKTRLMTDVLIRVKDVFITVYVVVSITLFLLTVVNISVDIYKSKAISGRVPVGLHAHILKIFISICSILTLVSLVLGVSISSLFTSIGAAAALLTFVFKDTVLGLLASLQLTFQDIIKVGDWVTLPSYNADGNIQKITITVVLIKNFDNTYTTVPTSAFLSTGVRNWRSVFDLGGRRIRRSISIDMDTIKMCDQKSLNKYKKLPVMDKFAEENKDMFDANNSITNLTIFRWYVDQYLRNHDKIHQQGFTFLVRQLAPTPTGVPIEVYVFTNDTNWINYEGIQSGIFDHFLGVLPQFELKAFQTVFVESAK